MHSSTITVAVFDRISDVDRLPYLRRQPEDFEVSYYSGTGPGGQNRNKVLASCRLKHLPTGLIKSSQTRSRLNSYRLAHVALCRALDEAQERLGAAAENLGRRAQVGAGERSDRRRTWSFQRDQVDDFLTGNSMRCSDALRGMMDRLW